jgi:hypothetical protein
MFILILQRFLVRFLRVFERVVQGFGPLLSGLLLVAQFAELRSCREIQSPTSIVRSREEMICTVSGQCGLLSVRGSSEVAESDAV